MSYEKILEDDCMKLPLDYDEDDFLKVLMGKLTDYEILLENLLINEEEKTKILDSAREFHCMIYEVFTFEYIGQHKGALECFNEILDNCSEIEEFKRKLTEKEFLRIRYGEYTEDEMFHIPFNKRRKVRTQRYSYPGLPCLYLGETEELCLGEIGRNVDEKKTIAVIRKKGMDINILDIAYTPAVILEKYIRSRDTSLVKSYLILWPLLLACSVCVKEKEEPFKPEYMIPQMLLEYLLKTDINNVKATETFHVMGIRYFSDSSNLVSKVRGATSEEELNKYCNYVFPAIPNVLNKPFSHLHKYFFVDEIRIE
ncbi:hypothetical protein [Anaeromicropila populeti]|uniref:RES domain-containing protein n=1 Tax=Anaeromicropila populeti TaxID=37658 RepID=A0A1I6LVD0_9FIRM|nr:hypothetical protein [Anaeromicropila populeti]SFS07441.1 hypothetical protein SAMN05661086_03597 [Anaeromicropila populeti]